ncbi:MAG: phosphoadenylyl-sulfate reductase [Pseudomonadota bacterium]
MSVVRLADFCPTPRQRVALETMDAEARVGWALEHLPGPFALTSSFGAQAAVMLHLVTRQTPDVPVILLDTGHLFPETYAFVDQLTERLSLNLHVFRAAMSPAWQEARYGRLWEQGVDGIQTYNRINKVEPLQRAFEELGVRTWFSGLRRVQASTRRDLAVLEEQDGRSKVLPLIDWTDRDVYLYLQKHDLPYHPLWSEGYVSIGDVHSTKSLAEVDNVDEVRFDGLLRECGIHQ